MFSTSSSKPKASKIEEIASAVTRCQLFPTKEYEVVLGYPCTQLRVRLRLLPPQQLEVVSMDWLPFSNGTESLERLKTRPARKSATPVWRCLQIIAAERGLELCVVGPLPPGLHRRLVDAHGFAPAAAMGRGTGKAKRPHPSSSSAPAATPMLVWTKGGTDGDAKGDAKGDTEGDAKGDTKADAKADTPCEAMRMWLDSEFVGDIPRERFALLFAQQQQQQWQQQRLPFSFSAFAPELCRHQKQLLLFLVFGDQTDHPALHRLLDEMRWNISDVCDLIAYKIYVRAMEPFFVHLAMQRRTPLDEAAMRNLPDVLQIFSDESALAVLGLLAGEGDGARAVIPFNHLMRWNVFPNRHPLLRRLGEVARLGEPSHFQARLSETSGYYSSVRHVVDALAGPEGEGKGKGKDKETPRPWETETETGDTLDDSHRVVSRDFMIAALRAARREQGTRNQSPVENCIFRVHCIDCGYPFVQCECDCTAVEQILAAYLEWLTTELGRRQLSYSRLERDEDRKLRAGQAPPLRRSRPEQHQSPDEVWQRTQYEFVRLFRHDPAKLQQRLAAVRDRKSLLPSWLGGPALCLSPL